MAKKDINPSFLAGGAGETAQLIQNHDWANTPAGPCAKWPHSLRAGLNMLLQAPLPMLIFWGEECMLFYNDAFLRIVRSLNQAPPLMGQSGAQAFPEQWATIGPLIDRIMMGAAPALLEEQPLPLYSDQISANAWFNSGFSALTGDDGNITGVLLVASDITQQVIARKNIGETARRLHTLIQAAPVAIGLFIGRDLVIETPNEAFIEIIGRGNNIAGRSLREVMPELESQPFLQILDNVFTTREPFKLNGAKLLIQREDKMLERYFDVIFSPIFNEQGQVTSILDISVDVTDQTLARKKLEDSEARFQNLFRDATVGLIVLSGDGLVVSMVNQAYSTLVGHWVEELWHRPIFEVLPEAEAVFRPIIDSVRNTGRPEYLNNMPYAVKSSSGEQINGFLNLVYQPYREQDGTITGVIVVVHDVTEQVIAVQKIAASESKFRSLITEAPYATAFFIGPDLIIDMANDAMIDLWGRSSAVIGMPLAKAVPELEGQPFIPLLQEALRTGEVYRSPEQSADLLVNGAMQRFWFNFTNKPLLDETNKVLGILNMAVDITSQVQARQKIEEAESLLSGAIELAKLATWNIDLTTGHIIFSKPLQQWLGLEDAAKTDWLEEIHIKDRARIQAAVVRAATPGSTGRLDETYTVINRQTGRQRIIHSVGKTLYDRSGKPVALSGTAQDITIQKELQLQLEAEVHERTDELASVVEELRAMNEALSETNNQLTHSNEEAIKFTGQRMPVNHS